MEKESQAVSIKLAQVLEKVSTLLDQAFQKSATKQFLVSKVLAGELKVLWMEAQMMLTIFCMALQIKQTMPRREPKAQLVKV